MHFENLNQIPEIASKSNFCIFQINQGINQSEIFSKMYHLRREEDEQKMSIETIRKISEIVTINHSEDLYILIEEAELVTDNAYNAFLKHLEEPGEHIHYLFLTTNLNAIIPTVRSRAFCYIEKRKPFDIETIDIKLRAKVKEYITAKPKDYEEILKPILKDKKSPRDRALELTDATTKLCYDTFLKTGNQLFLKKLSNAISTHEGLQKNGNLRIQLIANMV